MEEEKSTAGQGLGIAGLVVGIIALIFAFIPCFGFVAIIPGIIAIVLSAVGLSQATRENAQRGIIIAALIISILGTSLGFMHFFGWKFLDEVIKSEWFDDDWKWDLDRAVEDFEEGFEEEYGKSIDSVMDDVGKEVDITMDELEKEMEEVFEEFDVETDTLQLE
jgi:hypothetical protein